VEVCVGRLRNVTITVEEDVARWARVKAAEKDTSLARLVGEMLRRAMNEDRSYEEARRAHFAQRPLKLRKRGTYPRRDEIHER
jgi:hypothetical protein